MIIGLHGDHTLIFLKGINMSKTNEKRNRRIELSNEAKALRKLRELR
jgi:hypothetical protein